MAVSGRRGEVANSFLFQGVWLRREVRRGGHWGQGEDHGQDETYGWERLSTCVG